MVFDQSPRTKCRNLICVLLSPISTPVTAMRYRPDTSHTTSSLSAVQPETLKSIVSGGGVESIAMRLRASVVAPASWVTFRTAVPIAVQGYRVDPGGVASGRNPDIWPIEQPTIATGGDDLAIGMDADLGA